MKRDEAIRLKDELTQEFHLIGYQLRRLPPGGEPPEPSMPLGLGIAPGMRGEWLVAVRAYLKDWTPETRRLLAQIRKRCHGEVDAKIVGEPILQMADGTDEPDTRESTSTDTPLRVGQRIGTTSEHWGTLGWFVMFEDEKENHVHALTCAHILARQGDRSLSDLIIQPPDESAEMPTARIVGSVSRVARLPAPWMLQRVDAATISPAKGVEVDLAVGSRGAVREVLIPECEETVVVKHGAATEMTLGAISAQKLIVPVRDPLTGASMVFADQYEIEGTDPGGRFSAPGDSGALVLEPRTHAGIGLLIGGSGSMSYATPLNTVLTELNALPA